MLATIGGTTYARTSAVTLDTWDLVPCRADVSGKALCHAQQNEAW